MTPTDHDVSSPHPIDPANPSGAVGHEPWLTLAPGVEIWRQAWSTAARRVLTPAAVDLLAHLHRALERERQQLLAARRQRQAEWDAGAAPGYLTDDVARQARGTWRIAPLPADLLLRRVEITGPAGSARMVINMLSRGADGERADAAMLDFEDSMKPEWHQIVDAVENVAAAARTTLTHVRPAAGGQAEKVYRLDPDDMPLLMVRCRGLHLNESNLRIDGAPVAGGLLDLALCALHSAAALLERGKTPKYYVPKTEHHLESRWWDRLFGLLEERLALPGGSLRVTVLIETLPAAFQIEEILWELRGRITGCNVGRWDKIFSDIKVLSEHGDRVLADRASISLNRPWMKAYAERLIRVCHRHGAFAMGGMAAFTPGRSSEVRAEQTRKVVEDKRFEAALGHDGCWVSHPYFIGPAMSAFTRPNQLDVLPDQEDTPDLLPAGGGPRTLAGLRKNLRVGIAYTKGWNDGLGVVAWDDLMEDLATLEISRAQTWQWLRHGVALEADGGDRPDPDSAEVRVTPELVAACFREELARIASELRAEPADPTAPAGTASGAKPAAPPQPSAAAGPASPASPANPANPANDALQHEIDLYTKAAAEAEAIFTEATLRPFFTDRSELAGDGA